MLNSLFANFHATLRVLASAGWPALWLIPFRALFYGLYATGWLLLLRPNHHTNASPLYLLWATAVRDAVDRLLPVASVGGSVVGVRLASWRGVPLAVAATSIIVEIALTVLASYGFTALGLIVLLEYLQGAQYQRLLFAFLLSLPIPLVLFLVLRYGSIFARLQGVLRRLTGDTALAAGATALDNELRAALRRRGVLCSVAGLQCVALVSSSFEVWFGLRILGKPVNFSSALAIESLTQAARHVAFMIPAGIGAQEAAVVLFGHIFGVDGDVALALSLLKRMREVAWGVPALLTWQWAEGHRFSSRTQRA